MRNKSFIGFLFIFSILLLKGFAQQSQPPLLSIGAQAPGFSLKGIDGKLYSLADFDDYRMLVVVFWANHCPTAQAYEDRLMAMVEKYRPQGVGFAIISPNSPQVVSVTELGYSDLGDSFEEMIIRARDRNYTFPYLYDGDDHAASIKYGPVATPHVFIFDEERLLQYRGRIDDTENPYVQPNSHDAANALDALLAGRTPSAQETRTFGCSVKWKWQQEWKQTEQKRWEERPVGLEMANIQQINAIMENDTDKLVLVNVWATWCGPCIIEFPELVAIQRMYGARNFELVTISTDVPNRKENVERFLNEQTAATRNYLYASTDKYALMDVIDAEWEGALPHSLLIAPGGEILARYAGMIDPLVVKRDILDFLGRYFADDDK